MSCTFAINPNGAAVQLYQAAHNGQTQSQSGALTVSAGIALTKAIKYEGNQRWLNPNSRVANENLNVRVDPLRMDLNASVFGREFNRVGEQIPKDLPQAIRIACHWARCRVEQGCKRISLASAAGRTVSIAVSSTSMSRKGRISRRNLPLMMRDTSSRSLMIWSCAWAAAIYRIKCPGSLFLVQPAATEQTGPADNRIQRIAEFVRDRREKIILQPVGLFRVSAGRFGLVHQSLPFLLCLFS